MRLGRFEQASLIPVGRDDPASGGDERTDHGPPDAACSAGDDCYVSREVVADSHASPLPGTTESTGGALSGGCSGKWQAARCSPPNDSEAGRFSGRIACAGGRRVRKTHPDGGLSADGSSPGTPAATRVRCGLGTGIEASSPAV